MRPALTPRPVDGSRRDLVEAAEMTYNLLNYNIIYRSGDFVVIL
jgi:hypothetical protein